MAGGERQQQMAAVQALAEEVLVGMRAGRIGGLPALPWLAPVTVRISNRLTRSAGLYRAGDIALSGHYLAVHGVEGARPVLLHELAHHVIRALHGRTAAPHGAEFQAIAAALGAARYAEPFAAPRTVFLYRCPGCGQEWQRGRRVGRDRRYSCRRCAPRYDARFRFVFAGRRREA